METSRQGLNECPLAVRNVGVHRPTPTRYDALVAIDAYRRPTNCFTSKDILRRVIPHSSTSQPESRGSQNAVPGGLKRGGDWLSKPKNVIWAVKNGSDVIPGVNMVMRCGSLLLDEIFTAVPSLMTKPYWDCIIYNQQSVESLMTSAEFSNLH